MTNKPLVTTMHGTDVRLARVVAFSRPAFRHVLHRSTAVTAVSRWLADEAREIVSAPLPAVAPMPVATELFTPGGSREPKRLLFVGRLNKQKLLERPRNPIRRDFPAAEGIGKQNRILDTRRFCV